MSILVAADFDADEWRAWWPALQAALPGERLLRSRDEGPVAQIDVALVANPPPGALQGLPALALIQSLWAGVDRLLQDRSVPTQVPLARMVDPVMNRAMAETA
ncbi:MAG: glyoxylate/hydroxypyruvate reductase A, partial [Rhizobacter sp.]|nr:glyoxylate/hydroxypyruvate reductase A [Rhizobacter sp.]